MTFRKDSIQNSIVPSPWWEKTSSQDIEPGRLVFCFIPYFDQIPKTLEAVGRIHPYEHEAAEYRVAPLRIGASASKPTLTIAAMTLNEKENWVVYRAKKRPCLVIGGFCPLVDRKIVRGLPKRITAPTFLVAPFYGADQDDSRVGYPPEFIKRICHAVYPQFLLDSLPISGPKESILHLNQIQPVGFHSNSYELTDYCLSKDAIEMRYERLVELVHLRVTALKKYNVGFSAINGKF